MINIEELRKLNWQKPWQFVLEPSTVDELKRELNKNHVLRGKSCVQVARRCDNDDVVYIVNDEKLAFVHLTWSGKEDRCDEFPWTVIYDSVKDFVEKQLNPDIEFFAQFK